MRCDIWWRQWEGALGQWLRGQLDERGIDAPAYGRYVLSLLTGPLRPDDLSPETVPNSNKSWEKRNRPVQIEALKRSAAVQCLLNATDDQSSGIEQLVDELCDKIKEIEEKRGTKRNLNKAARRERTRTVSPGEMARLYYAAFPALGQTKENPEVPQPCKQWPSPPRGRRNTFHGPRTTPKHPKHRRDKSKNKMINNNNKEALPEWVTNEDVWDIEAQDPIKDFIKTITMDEGYATCDNTLSHDDHINKSKRLYERDGDFSPKVETIESILNRDWSVNDDYYAPAPPKTPAEEEIIAKFEAKFDRSLEALWCKEQNNTPDDEYQELPVDFQDLLASPSDKMFEGCNTPEKVMPLSMTASIWSNNSTCNPSECLLQNDTPDLLNDNFRGSQKNVWSNDYTTDYNNDTMEALYIKLQPLNLHDNTDETINNMEISSVFEVMQPIVNPSYQHWSSSCDLNADMTSSYYENPLDSAVPVATTAIHSLTVLNHSMNSSFSEVIPKGVTGFIGDSIKRKNEEFFSYDMGKPIETIVSFVKPDEDLLSSRKTHFCPIKKEPFYADSTVPAVEPKAPVVIRQPVESVVNFENGVTFEVNSDWDCIKISRSSTGTMFLESDNHPPMQYMEYRTQGIDYSRLDLSPSLDCDDVGLSASDLVLKFKVCQNEKSVQTDSPNGSKVKVLTVRDEFDRGVISSPESSIFSMDREEKQETALDTDSELESLEVNWIQCDHCKTNSNSWVTNQMTWQPNRYNSNKIWSSDEHLCKECEELRAEARAKRSETQKSLVHKEETAREWEELLSDITYARSMQSEKYWSDEANTTPSDDDYYLAPREISICALDGNYIKSASAMMGGLEYKNRRNGDLYDSDESKDEFRLKVGSNIVGCILDRAVNVSGEGVEREGGRGEGVGGVGPRKRRHSAGGGGAGKLRCPLPLLPPAPPPTTLPLPLPLLTCSLLSHLSLNERPLTR